MGTRRFSRARPTTWWRSSVLLVFVAGWLAGCSFDVRGLDLPVGDAATHDLASSSFIDLFTPARDLVAPDLRGGCPGGGTPTHLGDLAEGDLSDWDALAPMPWAGPIPPSLKVEADNKAPAAGLISLRVTDSSDKVLVYYPKSKSAGWDLSGFSELDLWVAADDSAKGNDPGWQETDPHVVIATSDADQFTYVPDLNHLPRNPGTWIKLLVPLSGGGGWTRSQTGSPSLSNVAWIGFSMDTNGAGFKVWLDGVTFGPGTFVDCN
jgi:hypothetical protein